MRFWVPHATLAQALKEFLPSHIEIKIIDQQYTVDDIPLDETIVWSTHLSHAPGLWSLHPRFIWLENPQDVVTVLQQGKKNKQEKELSISPESSAYSHRDYVLKLELKKLATKIQHLDRYQKFAEALARWDESENIVEWIKPWGAYFDLPQIEIETRHSSIIGSTESVSGQFMENHPDFPLHQWVMPLGVLKGQELYLASRQALNLGQQEAFIHMGYLLIHRIRKVASDWGYDHFHKLWKKVLNASQHPVVILEEQETEKTLLSNQSFEALYAQVGPELFNWEHKSEFLWQGQVHQLQKSQTFIDGKKYIFIFIHNIQQERERFINWSHHEKLDLLSKLSARLAHELVNPLSGILQICAYWLHNSLNLRPEIRDDLSQISQATQKTLDILQAFRTFSSPNIHKNANTHEKVQIQNALKRVFTLVKSLIKQMRLSITVPDEPLWIMVQPTLFEQVIINLIMNSAQACNYQGHIDIKVEASTPGLLIYVTDDGPGIPSQLQEKIFEPLFTTKTGEQKGTGLGLSLVKSLVTRWKGSITYNAKHKGGAQFIITLPLTHPPEPLHDHRSKDKSHA